MNITKEQRVEIRRILPRGSMSHIAEECGISRMAVSYWFRSQAYSPKIEAAVLRMLETVIRNETETQKRLQELLR
ncbi:hypothetical protein [Xylanibacter muris]|uniref:hypothetical protein n=1 Tax=Xylanibacter muris TaxID=2736290 RepID=UPI0025A0FB69|nr:hypothetical protein [Xylanibacter muris]